MPKDANLDLVEPDCGEVNCSESLSRDDVIAPANNDTTQALNFHKNRYKV